MKLSAFIANVFGFTFLFFGVNAIAINAQALVLNEIEFDAPSSTSEACQYVEIRGTPGATVPAGVQFISVNGDSGSFGDIQFPVSLGGRVVGPNGTITIINDLELCPGRTFPAGTTQVFVTNFSGLGQGAESYLLISSPNVFSEGDDIDDNNDRIVDPSDQITVIDGIGFTVNALFQTTYAPNLYDAATQGGGSTELPDAATRFSNNTTPLSAAAWYFGELAATPDNTTEYSGIPQSSNFPAGGALTPGGANLPILATPQKAIVDLNGDGKTDYTVTRSSGGLLTWFSSINGTGEVRGTQWGLLGDIAIPEDYDGDGKDDIAVWRPGAPTVAAFYIIQSSDSTVRIVPFGQTGDDPALTGDWDGDGKADPAVYRNAAISQQSYFFFRASQNNPSGNITYGPWGTNGDQGVRGDFDGDDKQDGAIFRPSDNTWWILQSSNSQVSAIPFGLSSDTKLSADFDGDRKTDIAIFRGGVWWVRQSSNGQVRIVNWGLAGDTPVPGDYDGDGSADFAVWRNGIFYVQSAATGSISYFNWGLSGDGIVASVFNN
ncbi:MAG: FG-GAP repeat domain-containing protein [Pyrinomonadaceae bacterium]